MLFLRSYYRIGVRFYSNSTIFALSSGQGKCGVAVIRVSGSNTENTLKLISGLSELPKPRTAILRSIKHPVTKDVLDKGLIMWFPGPRSFTGEDSCELHVHGGTAVVKSVLDALSAIPKCRLAEPGEFTRRAFHNGKLDLTEVEGLADLLQAETEAQRKQAFLQTHGALSKVYKQWKEVLVECLAHIEAHIDFDETETLEHGLIERVVGNVNMLKEKMEEHLKDGRKGELLRNGVKTVILGDTNVGKSSLLNILCQRPAAIVTPIEGTTRDVLEVTLNINGYPLVIADTAGLRSNTEDEIEKEGISRAIQMYQNADLVLLVTAADKYLKWKETTPAGFSEYVQHYIDSLGLKDFIKKKCLLVLNKNDLITNEVGKDEFNDAVKISCKTETGINALIGSLTEELKQLCGEPSEEHPSMNQMRHRQQISMCLNNLETFLKYVNSEDLVLMAEYLRKALNNLGKLVGTVTTEQLLDVIFRDFCIGK